MENIKYKDTKITKEKVPFSRYYKYTIKIEIINTKTNKIISIRTYSIDYSKRKDWIKLQRNILLTGLKTIHDFLHEDALNLNANTLQEFIKKYDKHMKNE